MTCRFRHWCAPSPAPIRLEGSDALLRAAIAAAEAAHHRRAARGASAEARLSAAIRAADKTLTSLFPARDARRLLASAAGREAEVRFWER